MIAWVSECFPGQVDKQRICPGNTVPFTFGSHTGQERGGLVVFSVSGSGELIIF
jgi:hypothetical protein